MDRKFYPGDVINYGILSNLTIIAEIDDKYYLVKDSSGNKKKIYQSLINKYGERNSEKRLKNEWSWSILKDVSFKSYFKMCFNRLSF